MKRSDFLTGKIKPEFGNLDHIKMVKEIENSDRGFKEGFIPDIGTRYIVQERCHCDEYTLEFEAEGETDEALINQRCNCPRCGRKYKLISQDDLIVIVYAK